MDALDNKSNLAYTFNPTSIGTRLETTSITHDITVTQTLTGKSVTVKATQAGAVYTCTSTATASQVAASGGESTVTISWTLYKDGELYKTGTSTPTSINGSDVSGDNITCTINGGKVKVPSAAKVTYSSARTVFNVTSWSFTADSKTFSGSGTVAVKQSANTTSDSWNSPVFNATANVTSINSSENPVSFNVDSYRTGTRTYTSGATDTLREDITANISTTLGTLSTTTVAGQNKYFTCTIGANTSGSSRTANVTVSTGANSKTITITQAGRTHSGTSYGTPTVKSTSIGGTIPASGGTVWLTVSWSQTQTLTYDNGTTSSSTVTGSSTATVTGGTAGGGSINGGGIYAASLGTTVTAARTVYTITSYSFTANGKTGTGTGSINVNQAENKVTNTASGSYNLSISANSTAAMANSGGTRTITVGCTQNKTDTYSSGSTKDYTTNATATVSTNTGWFNGNSSLTSTTVTGSGSLTLTVLENGGSARTITVTAKVSSTTKTVSFTQNAVSYEFTASYTSINAAYGDTSATLTGTSKKNGSGLDIQKAHVDISGGATIVGVPTNSNGTFTINLSFSANTSTSSKTYTVVVTQPGSGKTITYTITHAGKPGGGSGGGSVFRLENGSLGMIAGGVKGTATLVYHKDYSGKTATVALLINGTQKSSTTYNLTGTATENTMKVEVGTKTSFMDGVDVAELQATCGGASSKITLY